MTGQTDTRTLYDLFSAGVAAAADHVAIESSDTALTYDELNTLVCATADALLDAADHPVHRVGLLATKSIDAYVGYLAAAKLGATVVPVDPSHPAARNAWILTTADVDLLICDRHGAPHADRLLDAVPLVYELPARRRRAGTRTPAPHDDDRANPAYILFTSGSTGSPKGVPIGNHAVAAYVDSAVRRYQIGPGARLSHTFALTFDLSVFDLFCAWAAGATLVVPNPSDAVRLVYHVAERRITHWFSVPSAISLAARLNTLTPASMPTLQQSLFCGEQLTLPQAAQWHLAAPNSRIDNLYGPTELTITCTAYQLSANPDAWPATHNGAIPIGRTHDGLESLVADEAGRPAHEGELCIRGHQRFAGYLDPHQNHRRFLAADGSPLDGPASREPDPSAWYRTGDLVRWHGNELLFLGRLDDQLKISGYRIEPGEIEATLRQHDAVDDAVVVTTQANELLACCVGTRVPPDNLRTFLRDHLPAHMVPRHYRWIPLVPLTSNGKTDRAQLRAQAPQEGL